jgi:hypothetical protein
MTKRVVPVKKVEKVELSAKLSFPDTVCPGRNVSVDPINVKINVQILE